MDKTREPASQHYRGKRYIAYARCASTEEAPAKLQDQILRIRLFGYRLGMQCVGEVRLSGVSGYTPLLRDDLRDVLRRKRQRNDFDMVVMADYARLTRTGIAGGRKIEAEFAKCGVQIVYLAEVMLTEQTATGFGFQGPRGDSRRNL